MLISALVWFNSAHRFLIISQKERQNPHILKVIFIFAHSFFNKKQKTGVEIYGKAA